MNLVQAIKLQKEARTDYVRVVSFAQCGLLLSSSSAQIDAKLSNLFMKLYSPSSSNILLLFYFISRIPTVKTEVISSRAAPF